VAIDPDTHYSTVEDANSYFENRLHEYDWSAAPTANKEKALLAATKDVDALVYDGYKTPAYDLLQADPDATDEELEAAADTQLLEFPRGGDADVPDDILFAVYEIAHERLRGRDPGMEIENLTLTSDGIGSTRVTSDRANPPLEHLANGIVSWVAWRYLQPYLANSSSFNVRRI
jgi:hypothetical protein